MDSKHFYNTFFDWIGGDKNQSIGPIYLLLTDKILPNDLRVCWKLFSQHFTEIVTVNCLNKGCQQPADVCLFGTYHVHVYKSSSQTGSVVVWLSWMINNEGIPFVLPHGVSRVLQMRWQRAVPTSRKDVLKTWICLAKKFYTKN